MSHLFQNFKDALSSKSQDMDSFSRCIVALERRMSICASESIQSERLWEDVQACEDELREYFWMSGKALLVSPDLRCAALVAAEPAEQENGAPAPRPKSYSKPGLEKTALVAGLFSLNKALDAAILSGNLNAKGDALVDPMDVYRGMDAEFGLAMLSNPFKKKLLFEAFEELGLARPAGGSSAGKVLADEAVVVILPAIKLLMDPERMAAVVAAAEANKAMRDARTSSSASQDKEST